MIDEMSSNINLITSMMHHFRAHDEEPMPVAELNPKKGRVKLATGHVFNRLGVHLHGMKNRGGTI